MPDFAVKTAFTAVDGVSSTFNRMGNSADRFGKKTSSVFSQLASAAGMFGGIALLAMGLKKVVTSAMMIEDAQASFTPLLGSVEKATKLVEMLNVAAAETPFQFEDLAKVAKQLLPVMDGDLNNTIRTMKMLGDTAGGNADKLDSVTRGYTKAMLKGKVDMESLNMIAEAGVPIHTELAKSMGYGKDRMQEFFKKVSSGTVDTKQLTKAFEVMTSKGGLFFQGMIIASKTTSGVLSTMWDNLTMVAAAIGMELLPTFKDIAIAVSEAAGSVLNFIKENKGLIQTIVSVAIPALKWLVIGFVACKVALKGIWLWKKAIMALNYVSNLSKVADMMKISGSEGSKFLLMIKQTAIWQKAAAISTKLLAGAQWLLNIAMSANPIGLIIIGIIALVAFVAIAIKNWNKFGAAMMVMLGPIGMVISMFMAIKTHWDNIVTAFQTGGILEGLKAIGVMLLDMVLLPLQQILEIASNIPGIGGLAGAGAEKIKSMREGMGIKAPNESAVALQGNNTTVNVNSNGTQATADVTPKQGAKINMDLGYQF